MLATTALIFATLTISMSRVSRIAYALQSRQNTNRTTAQAKTCIV